MIAEDQTLFRQGVCGMLDDDDGFLCIGEASDGFELLVLLEKELPNAVLLDFLMPEMDGLETLQHLRRHYADLPVLILTLHAHEYVLHGLIDAGASGILLKEDTHIDEIKAALVSAVKTGHYFNSHFSPISLNHSAKRLRTKKATAAAKLDEREIIVLRFICDGLSSEDIAPKIHASTRTVERIRSELLKKTGARHVSGLVVFALQTGLYIPHQAPPMGAV